MAVELPVRLRSPAEEPGGALHAVAAAMRAVAEAPRLSIALAEVARAGVTATGADVAVVRVLDIDGQRLVARAVHAASTALSAELTSSVVPVSELGDDAVDTIDGLPQAVRRVALQARADAALLLPVRVAGAVVASLELLRRGRAFDVGELVAARLVADQVATAVRAFAVDSRAAPRLIDVDGVLELTGDALAAGSAERSTPQQIARVAAVATGARACLLWRADGGSASLLAAGGIAIDRSDVGVAAGAAERAVAGTRPAVTEALEGLPADATVVTTLQLGQPPIGALQLLLDEEPPEDELPRLATFAVRVAHALRSSDRTRTVSQELERARAILAVSAEANEELSLAHTLETALERVAELLDVDRVVLYLTGKDGELAPAAGRGSPGVPIAVAERLLELALGPFRARGMLAIEDARADSRLSRHARVLEEAGVEAIVAVPLLVSERVIGLLAMYPARHRALTPHETELTAALAAQIAVAVQNAALHEEAKNLNAEREEALAREQQSARSQRALYRISRSFAQSLSLQTTLDTVARAVVELLGVDAAVIRMPDARGETLVPRALHVADERVAAAVRAILDRPQPFETASAKRLYRTREPLELTPERARELGPPHALLIPFLEKGSTAVIVPIATPGEVIGTLKLLSLDPERPITAETVQIAMSAAGQAALALENARLYQQQKAFADTMQRSLLPRSRPQIDGLELGEVYESSARVDVGGDLYDFMTLDDGRLAVVVGDVTGHGIDAAADMAMAKFVFRSFARERPEPGELLASANDVVVGEIASGKFITMLYLVIDPRTGELAAGSAGHPSPRIVLPDGSVHGLDVRGLALGIDTPQSYAEVRERLPVGATVVLFTDGVVEARRGGELYGQGRLDALLSARRELAPPELATAILADCRAFAGEELADDCAIVVIRRTG